VESELRRVVKAADKAQRAQAASEAARQELYAAMRDARAAGVTITRLATTLGVTRQRVKQILDRHAR
jgi:hypothetical protein